MNITFDHVSLQHPYEQYVLLKDIHFNIDDGVSTILCDTQSGKTSLCRLLIKDLVPTSGNIFVDGKSLSSITNQELGILYLPKDGIFFESRTVLYNIAYPLLVRKLPKQQRHEQAKQIATKLQIEDLLNTKVKKLSVEQRALVALARGLTVKRKMVIFDDFFEHVPLNLQRVLQMFDCNIKLIVTSNPMLAQGNVVVLDGGNTVFCGDADQAKQFVSALGWISFVI